MVAIKTLAQLTLSRPSAQTPPARSPPSAHVMPARPETNENYYLSDDELVTARTKSGRSPAHSQTDLSILPTANLSWALPVLTPVTLPPAQAPRSRHNIPGPPTATVACGHAIQPTPHTSGAHRPLLSTLLSVSARASAPAQAPSAAPRSQLPQHEASHVSKVGTRLRELVNRVFPSNADNGLSFLGRMAPRPHVALEFGEALKHELTVSSADSYTSRAILRTAVIPALTIYICRLEPLLVPISTHPAALFVPKNVKEVDTCLPLVLNYNIEVIRSAWMVRNSVEEICGGTCGDGNVSCCKFWVDGLGPFVHRLDAIIQRFMGPYLLEIKSLVMDRISKFRLIPHHYFLDHCEEVSGVGSTLLSPIRSIPLSFINRNSSPSIFSATTSWVSSSSSTTPPGIITTTSSASSHNAELINELGAMLEGIRKILLVRLDCGNESRKWMVSIASQAVWKAMLAFASRPVSTLSSSSTSSTTTTTSTTVLGIQPLDSVAIRSTRQLLRGTVVMKRSSITLNQSPEYLVYKELAGEVKAFGTVIEGFVKDIAGLDSTLKLNHDEEDNDCVFCKLGVLVANEDDEDEDGGGDLVREAMNEALSAFSAFQVILLGLLQPSKILTHLTNPSLNECQTLKKSLKEIPPIIFLHLLSSRIPKFKPVHLIWNLNWSDYSKLLKSFTVSDLFWTLKISKTMLVELNRLVKQEENDREEKENCLVGYNRRNIEKNGDGVMVEEDVGGQMGLVLETFGKLILDSWN